MIVITHPDNIKLVTKDLVNKEMGGPFFFGDIRVVQSDHVPRTRISGYKPKSERFFEWGICDWTIYFGFVEPIYEPVFYIYEEGNSFINYCGYPEKIGKI